MTRLENATAAAETERATYRALALAASCALPTLRLARRAIGAGGYHSAAKTLQAVIDLTEAADAARRATDEAWRQL